MRIGRRQVLKAGRFGAQVCKVARAHLRGEQAW
jgi:hypothetical protein